MLDRDREAVEALYKAGAIQVLISTYKLCWELNLHSQVVIILDNQRYDGRERRYIDYTIPDMLQMICNIQFNLYHRPFYELHSPTPPIDSNERNRSLLEY